MSSTLNVIITDAGIAEVINAQHTGTAPVVLTQVGFGRGIYTPTASQTALHDEIKRVSTIAGGVVGDNIMHIQALDSGDSAYAVYEIGVYTASGTLFAVYSQPLPILYKVPNSEIMCVIDFVLSGVEPTAVTVGDTNYTLAPATTTNQGVVELATNEEVIAGTDTERAITPSTGAAAYVSLVNDQAVGGKKTFESMAVGRMSLEKNIVSGEDKGISETFKNDSNTVVIRNTYFVNGDNGSYNISVNNTSGNPGYDGASVVVSHTNSYASASNYAKLQILGATNNTTDGFFVQYDSSLTVNTAIIRSEANFVYGNTQFSDSVNFAGSVVTFDHDVEFSETAKFDAGFTGTAPAFNSPNTTVPVGGIFLGFVSSGYPGISGKAGEILETPYQSQTYYIGFALATGTTISASGRVPPNGKYVALNDFDTSTGCLVLLQRVE